MIVVFAIYMGIFIWLLHDSWIIDVIDSIAWFFRNSVCPDSWTGCQSTFAWFNSQLNHDVMVFPMSWVLAAYVTLYSYGMIGTPRKIINQKRS